MSGNLIYLFRKNILLNIIARELICEFLLTDKGMLHLN